VIGFQEKTISELIKENSILAVQDGNHGEKHPKSSDYVESGIHFVMANDLNSGSIDLKGCNKIPENLASKLRIGFSKQGDVLLTHKGTIGNVAIVGAIEPYVMLTPQVTYYRTDDDKLSNRYLAYAFRDPMFQKRMKSLAQQSTRPYIGITAQRNLKILWTERKTQDLVVEVLSKYDDLIENNKRRIELLEESAWQLYKEWFVRFRFPGNEHVKIIDGVPEGWKYKRLIDVANLTMGQSPKSEFYNSEEDGLPFHQGVTNYCIRFVEYKTWCTKPTRIAEAGDILFSVRAPVGRLNVTLDNLILGRGLAAIRSKMGFQSFLFYQLKSVFFKEDMIGGGAIYASVTKKGLENQELLVPDNSLTKQYEEFASDIDSQIKALHLSNKMLVQARDFLLPKLMSGEIVA